jgi:hypothetical protein
MSLLGDRPSQPLRPPMNPVTKRACMLLDSIAESAFALREQTELNERGIAQAFGIDMTNPDHVDWLSDIAADFLILKHRAQRIGDFAAGAREHDARFP